MGKSSKTEKKSKPVKAVSTDAKNAQDPATNTSLSEKETLKVVDAELDDLFKSSAGPIHAPVQPLPVPIPVHVPVSSTSAPASTPATSSKRKHTSSDPTVRDSKRHKSKSDKPTPKPVSTPGPSNENASDDSDNDHGKTNIEDAYLARKSGKGKASAPAIAKEKEDDQDASSADEEDGSTPKLPVHESLNGEKRDKVRPPKSKYIPEGESKEKRDERTIFIGNLPVEVAKSKSAMKGLTRLITTNVPGCKIESTRFRSIAFKNPTSQLPNSDDEDDTKPQKKQTKPSEKPDLPSTKELRQAGRAANWRSQQDENADSQDNKTFLTPAEKKRVAFIKGEFHETADTINAYIVFAYPDPARSANVAPIMDPFDAAQRAVETCDGEVYMERTIRVDRVSKGNADIGIGKLDPRSSVFVGNLDFQSKEEDVRAFFESVLQKEKGKPEEAGAGDETAAKASKSKAWVTHVRVVRDQATQLGKGFAYVEFLNRECVDEILALEQDKLKFAKRKLRVQRCKAPKSSKPSASTSAPTPIPVPSKSSSSSTKVTSGTPIAIPKGDPTLGDRLRGLDKEARRVAKSTDESRQARRLAKKKARNVLAQDGVAVASSGKGRKTNGAEGILGPNRKNPRKASVKAKVSRVRSANSATKRNAKK